MMKKIMVVLACNLLFCCFSYAGIDEADAAFKAGNYAVAFKETKSLAEQGDSYAQFNLARMYQDGFGTPKNNEQAVFWYTKSSEQGHAGSQFNLGIIHYNGLIVKKNAVLGYALIAVAAAGGDELAIDFVKNMSVGYPGKISRAQVQEAEKLSKYLLLSRDYVKTIKDYPALKVYENEYFKLPLPADKEWKLLEGSEGMIAVINTAKEGVSTVYASAFKTESQGVGAEFAKEANDYLRNTPLPPELSKIKYSEFVDEAHNYRCVTGKISAEKTGAPEALSNYSAKIAFCRHPSIKNAGVSVGYTYLSSGPDESATDQLSSILNSLQIKDWQQ